MLLALAFGTTTIGLLMLPMFAMGGAAKAYVSLGTIVVIIAVIYLSVRLWPIFPIIVVTNRVELGEAWALTRGRFGR